MRRSIVVAVVLVALAFVLVGGPSLFLSPSTDDVAPGTDDDPEIVRPEGSDGGFWPYLSDREAHREISPINVVVRGEPGEVVRLLSERGDARWEETDEDHLESAEITESVLGNETDADDDGTDADADEDGNVTIPLSPTDVPWSQAEGGARLAYVDPGPGEDAFWTRETLQLEDGEYYGHRYHIRLYESPNPEDRWVIMQTHSEHFDWFTLRHRVDGSQEAQARLERDLVSIPAVDDREDVRRINLGNGGSSDADGWATAVDLAAVTALLGIGLGARREGTGERLRDRVEAEADEHITDVDRARLAAAADRLDARHLILAGTIAAIVLGVRVVGVALDRHVTALSAHEIAALLYPLIAVGLPVATYVIASGLESRLDAAVAASSSLAASIWLDYGLLGVDSLPIDVVLQRMLVVVALGLIAGGAARRATRESRWNDLLVVGVALWLLVLVGTLFGYL